MSWSVLIPSARAHNLVRSIRSVLATHPGIAPSRLIVIDDGARSDAERFLPKGITWVNGVKPFVYARNINLGAIVCQDADAIIIMGDDVEVLTENGFDVMSHFLTNNPLLGVLSAGVQGVVGNVKQRYKKDLPFVEELEALAFVCVAIPRSVWGKVGTLDEQFVGYGFEDNDYCLRVKHTGLALGVLNECVVRHDGSIPSTFRSRSDYPRLFEENRMRWHRKWNIPVVAK